jgi:hypothetical protein
MKLLTVLDVTKLTDRELFALWKAGFDVWPGARPDTTLTVKA